MTLRISWSWSYTNMTYCYVFSVCSLCWRSFRFVYSSNWFIISSSSHTTSHRSSLTRGFFLDWMVWGLMNFLLLTCLVTIDFRICLEFAWVLGKIVELSTVRSRAKTWRFRDSFSSSIIMRCIWFKLWSFYTRSISYVWSKNYYRRSSSDAIFGLSVPVVE